MSADRRWQVRPQTISVQAGKLLSIEFEVVEGASGKSFRLVAQIHEDEMASLEAAIPRLKEAQARAPGTATIEVLVAGAELYLAHLPPSQAPSHVVRVHGELLDAVRGHLSA